MLTPHVYIQLKDASTQPTPSDMPAEDFFDVGVCFAFTEPHK
jgi:hypothetical protein